MDGFDQWRSDFLIKINSTDDFGSVLEQCIIYIEQIVYYNILLPPNSKQTESFLLETLKPSIETLLKYEVNSNNRAILRSITDFFKKSSSLIIWSFRNNNFKLLETLTQIINPEAEFFKSIQKLNKGDCFNLKEIEVFIIEHEYFSIIELKLKERTQLNIDHFFYFFRIFGKLSKSIKEDTKFSILFQLYEIFQNFLIGLIKTDVPKNEAVKLNDLYTSFCVAISSIDITDVYRECIKFMTILASNLFNSPDFEKKKIGSSLFKIFIDTKSNQEQETINTAFMDCLNEDLISQLISGCVHPEVIQMISPLFGQLSNSDRLSKEDLLSLWEMYLNNEVGGSNELLQMIQKILSTIKISDAENFFKDVSAFTQKDIENKDSENARYENHLQEFTQLIVYYLKSKSIPEKVTSSILNKLFDTSEDYIQLFNKKPDDCLNLEPLYKNVKENNKDNNSSYLINTRKELIEVLRIRLTEKYMSFIVNLMHKIAQTSSNLKNDFKETDVQIITKYIIELSKNDDLSNEDDNQYSLYPLYKLFISGFNIKINSAVLKEMMKSPSDAFWDLLTDIISKSNLNSFEEDAIQGLSEFILNNYKLKSDLFLDFLRLFILNMNVRNNTIQDFPSYSKDFIFYKIKKTPLLFETDVLDKIIIETDDDSILKHAINICLDIYSKYENKEEVVFKLLKMFNKYVNEENTNTRVKMNVIKLLFDYCTKNDKKTIMDNISHNKVFEMPSSTNTGSIKINFNLPEDEKFTVNCKALPSIHSLFLMIAPYLHSSVKNYYIHKLNGKPLSLNDTLYSNIKEVNLFVDNIKSYNSDENDKKDENNKKDEENKKDENNKKDEENKKDENNKKDEENKKDENGGKKDDKDKEGKKDEDKKKDEKIKINGGGYFGSYVPAPSEFFVLNNVSFSLFNLLKHFDSSEASNDETQNKLDELVFKFISYLPTDPKIFEASDSSEQFFPEKVMNLNFQGYYSNRYALQYLFQTLILRFRCPKYIDSYIDVLTRLLTNIINSDDESLTLSSFIVNELLIFIELLNLNSEVFNLVLLKMLKLTLISSDADKCKLKIIKILSKFKLKLDILYENFDLFNEILTSVSNTIWSEFKSVIFNNSENPENLFNSISQSLLECKEEDIINQINRYYTDIFSHFILMIVKNTNNVNLINNYIKIYMKIMRNNPTTTYIELFQKVINEKSDILSAQDNECSLTSIVNGLINIVRLDTKPQMMGRIIDLLIDISAKNKNKQQLIDFAEEISSCKIKEWNQESEADQLNNNNYDDENRVAISNKDRGLKNLNQTCYMNSALQQFYHIPAFRYLVAKDSKKEDEEDEMPIIPSLSSLFHEMEFSRKSSISPEHFFTIFSIKHANFEKGQQQDAQEFIDYFIEDIKGEAHDLFEGKLFTKYQKLDDLSEISSQDEAFDSIPLSVESESMNESLKQFFSPQRLTGDNLYQTSNGVKMESIVTQKIKVAPPVLIFQLKRFAYDKETHNRVKINKRFEILNTISIKNFLLNPNQGDDSFKYILNGIVVHAGNGMHGHYTSLIKENINSDNWIKYDDSSVERILTHNEFVNLAFGSNTSNDQYGTSGYLLFYFRENATINITLNNNEKVSKFILDNSFPIEISSNDERDINNKNNQFLFNQCILEKSTFSFMIRSSTHVQLFKYFFGVFVHTKMTNKIKEIKDVLFNYSKKYSNDFLKLMNDDEVLKNLILPVFSGSCPDKMEKAAFEIINKIITSPSSNKDLSGKLVQRFIENLKAINKNWNRICDIGSIILNYINNDEFCHQYAVSNNWEKMLLSYIFNIYEDTKFIKTIDLNTIFEVLNKIIQTNPSSNDMYEKLPSIYSKVKESDSDATRTNYKELIVTCIGLRIFTVDDIMSQFGSDFGRINFILGSQLKKAKPDTFPVFFFESLLSAQGFTAEEVVNYIGNDSKMAEYLLKPNIELLIAMLTFQTPLTPKNDMRAARKVAEMITKPVIHLDDSEMHNLFHLIKTQISVMEKAYPPFFTVLNWLIKSLSISADVKIEGLDKLIENSEVEESSTDGNSNNEDMINVVIHFNPDKLTTALTKLLDEALSSDRNDSYMKKIVTNFDNAVTHPVIFAQAASLQQWKLLFKEDLSSSFISGIGCSLNKMIGKIDELKSDRISLVNSMSYLYSLIVQKLVTTDFGSAAFASKLNQCVNESLSTAKEIIYSAKDGSDNLIIEPDFSVIFNFNAYLKCVELIMKNPKRNDSKDLAMSSYSQLIINLINASSKFANEINDDENDKLKTIRDFINKSLSSMTIDLESNAIINILDKEKNEYIMSLFSIFKAVHEHSSKFDDVANDFINRQKDHSSQFLILLTIQFKLKEISVDDLAKLYDKSNKHRDLFYKVLADSIGDVEELQIRKKIVTSMFMQYSQMNEKSFMPSKESNSTINEKNFFLSNLSKLTDDEIDKIIDDLVKANETYLVNPDNKYLDYLLSLFSKLMILVIVKPDKKTLIVQSIPESKNWPSRPNDLLKMIKEYKK